MSGGVTELLHSSQYSGPRGETLCSGSVTALAEQVVVKRIAFLSSLWPTGKLLATVLKVWVCARTVWMSRGHSLQEHNLMTAVRRPCHCGAVPHTYLTSVALHVKTLLHCNHPHGFHPPLQNSDAHVVKHSIQSHVLAVLPSSPPSPSLFLPSLLRLPQFLLYALPPPSLPSHPLKSCPLPLKFSVNSCCPLPSPYTP